MFSEFGMILFVNALLATIAPFHPFPRPSSSLDHYHRLWVLNKPPKQKVMMVAKGMECDLVRPGGRAVLPRHGDATRAAEGDWLVRQLLMLIRAARRRGASARTAWRSRRALGGDPAALAPPSFGHQLIRRSTM